VDIEFDPAKVSFKELVDIFWQLHDPTTLNRQGNDVGTQYRSGIYFTQPEQAQVARELIGELSAANAFGRPIVTEVLALDNYSVAEDYHQDFFERNPYQGYCMAVAAPKVEKFKKTFARLVRE
jgi:peptide-methionine (S)-S-oxide reductase